MSEELVLSAGSVSDSGIRDTPRSTTAVRLGEGAACGDTSETVRLQDCGSLLHQGHETAVCSRASHRPRHQFQGAIAKFRCSSLGWRQLRGLSMLCGRIFFVSHCRSNCDRRTAVVFTSASVTTKSTLPSLSRMSCNSFGYCSRTRCSPDPSPVGIGTVWISRPRRFRLQRNRRTNVSVRASSQSSMTLALIPANREQ
jgi:hypothetical protein